MHSPNSARDRYRILLVDDAPAVRESLRWLLEDEPGLTVIGDAASGYEAIQMTVRLKPDLVLLDIELSDLDGFEVTRQVKAMSNPPKVVILSMHNDALYRKRGMDAGCDAFIGKEMGWNGLLPVLQKVLEGR
jgi:DNA-binding NarL/FixJ family response regulator